MPNDVSGDTPQRTGLQCLHYVGKYNEGPETSLDLTNFREVCDLNDMPRAEEYGFNHHIMRAHLGLREGRNGPKRSLRKGILYLYHLLKVVQREDSVNSASFSPRGSRILT